MTSNTALALWGRRKVRDETGQVREGFWKEEKFKQNFEVEVYGLENKKKKKEGEMTNGADGWQ